MAERLAGPVRLRPVAAAPAGPPPPAPRRLTYTVTEAAALLGISRAKAYEAVRSGELPALRFGKRLVVPAVALEALLGPLPEPPAA